MASPSSQHPPARRDAKPHSPWRRSACDRCRSQKLCCTRKVEDPTGTCNRCSRMHLMCNTSAPKMVGRPPRKTPQLSEKSNLMKKSEGGIYHIEPSLLEDKHESILLTSPDSTLSPLDLASPFPRYDGSSEDVSMAFHSDGSNFVSMLDFENDSTGQSSSSSSNHHHEYILPTPTPSQPPTDASSEMIFDYFSLPVERNLSVYTPITDGQTDSSGRLHGTVTNTGILLATLQKSLAKQAVFLRMSSWDSSDLCMNAISDTDATPNGIFHPLPSILKSTTQLLTILQHFKTQPPNSSPQPPSSPPVTDMAISITCYLLVISILDTIFRQIVTNESHLSMQVASSSTSSSASSTVATPSPYIGLSQRGPEVLFVPLTPRLRLRLLVQVVEHQLELLERALGLPNADCVSTGLREDPERSSEKGNGGFLYWRETRILFRAAMEADDIATGAGEGSARRAAATLRENLKIARRASSK